MRRLSLTILFALAVLLPVGSATAYTITLNPSAVNSELETFASDFSGGDAIEDLFPSALPHSATSSSTDGGSSSESDYDLSNDSFSITFDHARTTDGVAYSQGDIFFSVDENVDYTAAGSYTAVDSDGRVVSLRAQLFDVTGSSLVFRSEQTSTSTPNESFTPGLSEGDALNDSVGSLTGTLTAGHE